MFFNLANLEGYTMTQLCEAILVDFSASDWIKGALRSALERDPVDALNDAEIIVSALRENLDNAQRVANEYLEQK
jgi:hypothetical protein